MPFTFKSFDATPRFEPVGTERVDGSVFTFDVPKTKVTMQWFTGGSASVAHLSLQLSLDGVNFFDTGNNVGLSGVITIDEHRVVAARASLQLLSGGGDATLTAVIAVEPTETAISITQS